MTFSRFGGWALAAGAAMTELDDEKRFYERFGVLVDDPDLKHVFERFGYEAFRRSSVLEGFEKFVVDNSFAGETCVVIGTLKGLTAIVLARYFDKVVTIDVIDDPMKYKIVAMLGVRNVEFVNVPGNFAKADFIGHLQFDAAYVDGDHVHDTETDFALVRPCGRVLFHEHWSAQPAVTGLVARLQGRVVTEGKLALWTR